MNATSEWNMNVILAIKSFASKLYTQDEIAFSHGTKPNENMYLVVEEGFRSRAAHKS